MEFARLCLKLGWVMVATMEPYHLTFRVFEEVLFFLSEFVVDENDDDDGQVIIFVPLNFRFRNGAR